MHIQNRTKTFGFSPILKFVKIRPVHVRFTQDRNANNASFLLIIVGTIQSNVQYKQNKFGYREGIVKRGLVLPFSIRFLNEPIRHHVVPKPSSESN